MVDYGLFDRFCGQVGQIAYAVLASTAQEVVVAVAIAALGFCVDQAGGSVSASAAVAEQITLQVVLQDAVPLSKAAPHVHDVLYSIEQFLSDDRFMAAGVQLILEVDPTGIVRILKQLVPQLERHRTFRDFALRPGCQPHVRHRGFQTLQSVVTCCVKLERLAHQRSSLVIEGDGVDELAFELHPYVQITHLGEPKSPAVDSLGAHLLLDIQALQLVHQVVHHVEHAFHCLGVRPLAEVLLCAQETNTHGFKLGFDDGRVEAVPEGARAHVDDDVLDLRMFGQVAQELSEDGTFVHRLGGVAGLNELLHDVSTDRAGLFLPPFTLGEDREAVRVDVDGGLKLSLGRDTKEQNCFPRSNRAFGMALGQVCLLRMVDWEQGGSRC